MALAAKNCYTSSAISELAANLTTDSVEKLLYNLFESGHESPLEHVSFTFAIEGVSRSLLAQLTRHRIASYSVQSQRYVKMDRFQYAIPEAILLNQNTMRLFEDAMEYDAKIYSDLHAYLMSEYLMKKYGRVIACDNPKYYYLSLDAFMDRQDDETRNSYKRARSAADKFASENARAVLPNAATTQLVLTMNARELKHFFALRCCERAQDEIRELANRMLVICQTEAPHLFANAGSPCVRGVCPEGKMSCGNPKGKAKID